MKSWLLLVVSLIATVACAAEWQSQLTPTQPGSFPLLRPLHAHYKFGWSAFTAADADFDFTHVKGGLLRLNLKTKTSGVVRTMWRLDAEHTSLVRASTLQPVRLDQKEVYRDESRTTQVVFDGEAAIRTRESVPPDPSAKKKTKRFESPNILDLHSALHFVRSQPLKAGDVYKLLVYPASAPYLAEVDVVGKDRVDTAGRKWNATKMNLKLWRVDDDDLELKPYTKFKRATMWVSDDKDRLLLKVQAELFIGSVWAELDQVEFR